MAPENLVDGDLVRKLDPSFARRTLRYLKVDFRVQ